PDYLLCLRMYAEAGIDLRAYPAVGIGSVCRREDSEEIHEIIGEISVPAPGVKLHGFGVQTRGSPPHGDPLTSPRPLPPPPRPRALSRRSPKEQARPARMPHPQELRDLPHLRHAPLPQSRRHCPRHHTRHLPAPPPPTRPLRRLARRHGVGVMTTHTWPTSEE